MKPLLLFDMDGTLIIQWQPPDNDNATTHYGSYLSIKQQMKEIAVKHGVPAELVEPLDRMALIWNAVRGYLEEHQFLDEEIKAIIAEINEPFMAEERADHNISILIPDTVPGLETLKEQGYEMGLVTNASRVSYDRISSSQTYGCFGRFFKHSVTRDECKYIKPDPEPINKILDVYQREAFVYVGDSDHDALACKAAGGLFVLINTRGYDQATIQRLETDHVISRLTELPGFLEYMGYNHS